MSILKIATLSGVSKATVSKVMSQSDEISPATRDKVIAAANELGLYDKYYNLSVISA